MKKQMKVGMLGLGVVGSGVVEVLANQKERILAKSGTEVQVTKVFARNIEEKKQFAKEHALQLVTEAADIIDDPEIAVVVEVMGKIEPARTLIQEALKKGKHVVTANKDLLAQYGNELVALAKENQRSLSYEASVAGGIPILRTIAESYQADEITEILGIVNGTTNYMLTQMKEQGLSYDAALEQAQQLGFAESDPTNDVDGFDAAYKTVILHRFAFGCDLRLADFKTSGIRHLTVNDLQVAETLKAEIKLIAQLKKTEDGIFAEVAPMLVAKSHPLAAVHNEKNAVFIKSTGIGEAMYYGPGAGSLPTATSVVADLVTIAENDRLGYAPQFSEYQITRSLADPALVAGRYYLAFAVEDEEKSATLRELLLENQIKFRELPTEAVTDLAVVTEPITLLQKLNLESRLQKLAGCSIKQALKIVEG